MTNYKIHFGKNISFKSNLIELLTSEKINNNLIYVKDNHLTLLAPGLHNQYLSYDNGRYTWKFMAGDFYQGVWPLSLYSTDFFTPDGYGSAIDVNPSNEFTYPQHMSMPYVDQKIVSVSGFMGKPNTCFTFSEYPSVDGLGEYGGTFYYEIYNAEKLNYSIISNINLIENEIIHVSGKDTEINSEISAEIFNDEVTLLISPGLFKMTKVNDYYEYNQYKLYITSAHSWTTLPYTVFNSCYENRINCGWCVQLTNDIVLPQSLTLIDEKQQFIFNNYSIIFGFSSRYDYFEDKEITLNYRI
jgi:hypothetical protein